MSLGTAFAQAHSSGESFGPTFGLARLLRTGLAVMSVELAVAFDFAAGVDDDATAAAEELVPVATTSSCTTAILLILGAMLDEE